MTQCIIYKIAMWNWRCWFFEMYIWNAVHKWLDGKWLKSNITLFKRKFSQYWNKLEKCPYLSFCTNFTFIHLTRVAYIMCIQACGSTQVTPYGHTNHLIHVFSTFLWTAWTWDFLILPWKLVVVRKLLSSF